MEQVELGTRLPLKRERDSNLELFRILTMLLIIAHHYVVNSDVGNYIFLYPDSLRAKGLLLFGAWGKTGINCFLLITGYFMCRSSITMQKYAKLVLEVLFYKLVCYIAFSVSGYHSFRLKEFFLLLWPIDSVTDGFTSCYLVFFLLIPFLNILIASMDQRQHGCLVLLLLFVYTVLGTIRSIPVSMNYVSWFAVVYIVGAYLRYYPVQKFENIALWGGLCLLCVLASAVSILLGMDSGSIIEAYYYVSDSNKPFAIATAVCAFLCFKNLRIQHNRWINWMGASTFGVLQIHANSDVMRTWLWRDAVKTADAFMTPLLPLNAVGSVIVIFLVCTLLDRVRIISIERPLFRLWDKLREKLAGRKKIEAG